MLKSDFCRHIVSKIRDVAKIKKESINVIKSRYAEVQLDAIRPRHVLGGMRGLNCHFCDTSSVTAEGGVNYRGHDILQLQDKLGSLRGGKPGEKLAPHAEGLMWVLLTGECPTSDDVGGLRAELHSRSQMPSWLDDLIDGLPSGTHPMTQLIIAASAMSKMSKFTPAYDSGSLAKNDQWLPVLDDALTLLALIPQVAGKIYQSEYLSEKPVVSTEFTQDDQKIIPLSKPSMTAREESQLIDHWDWAGNFMDTLIPENEPAREMMRLYLYLHADHEGGNVSSHAATLVASALTDVFRAYGAGMAGLAGPLHGLANQQCLKYLSEVKERLNGVINDAAVKSCIEEDVKNGRVIPGFGHAVLRCTDPRFLVQYDYAKRHIKNMPLFDVMESCYRVVPDILRATGKVKSPFPNVDLHSGVLLQYHNIKHVDFYTVVFGVARAIGISSQVVWNRILNMPIERMKSLSLQGLESAAKAQTTRSSSEPLNASYSD